MNGTTLAPRGDLGSIVWRENPVLQKMFVKSANVAARSILDEFILVPTQGTSPQGTLFYALNSVGVTVYNLIDGQKQVRELCDFLAQEYDVD